MWKDYLKAWKRDPWYAFLMTLIITVGFLALVIPIALLFVPTKGK